MVTKLKIVAGFCGMVMGSFMVWVLYLKFLKNVW